MGGGGNHSKNQDSGFLNNKENAIHPQESIEDSQQEAEQNDYDENADQDEGKNIQKDENSPDKVDNED